MLANTDSTTMTEIAGDDEDDEANVTLLSIRSTENSESAEESRGAANYIKRMESFEVKEDALTSRPRKSVLKKTPPSPVNTYTSSPSSLSSDDPEPQARAPRRRAECCIVI